MERVDGFTIIELIIVIVIIGILVTIGVIGPIGALQNSRDSERADDTAAIARLLELDYNTQVVGSPSYPSSGVFVNDSKTSTGTAAGADQAIFRAPGAQVSSITPSTVTAEPNPTDSNAAVLNTYVYQPLTSTGALCDNAPKICVSFRLYYRNEAAKPLIAVLKSMHQQ